MYAVSAHANQSPNDFTIGRPVGQHYAWLMTWFSHGCNMAHFYAGRYNISRCPLVGSGHMAVRIKMIIKKPATL
ncbi:hypothetical protein [Ferrovum myxofaciens]|uniref:hypothetical protein n=1 Tax=Ferrovum myxofaciens TaxID=416213 RepID=UPI003EBB4AEB